MVQEADMGDSVRGIVFSYAIQRLCWCRAIVNMQVGERWNATACQSPEPCFVDSARTFTIILLGGGCSGQAPKIKVLKPFFFLAQPLLMRNQGNLYTCVLLSRSRLDILSLCSRPDTCMGLLVRGDFPLFCLVNGMLLEINNCALKDGVLFSYFSGDNNRMVIGL